MPPLANPKHEAFCRQYDDCGVAAIAAEAVGYDPDHAANQGYRLLRRADVQARLVELEAENEAHWAKCEAERQALRDRLAAMRATEAEALIARLDPVYEAFLRREDYQEVMKVIALQAEIAGHLGPEEDEPARPRRRFRARRSTVNP